MKLIGSGSFTKAYLDDRGKVVLKSRDKAKECMSMGCLPKSKLFPDVKCIGDNLYEMNYLGPTKTGLKKELRPRQYRLYKALKDLFDKSLPSNDRNDSMFLWHDLFNTLPSEFRREKQVLKEALDNFGNWGTDVAFEISPRNVRVVNGFLCLLDCFFFRSDLH